MIHMSLKDANFLRNILSLPFKCQRIKINMLYWVAILLLDVQYQSKILNNYFFLNYLFTEGCIYLIKNTVKIFEHLL